MSMCVFMQVCIKLSGITGDVKPISRQARNVTAATAAAAAADALAATKSPAGAAPTYLVGVQSLQLTVAAQMYNCNLKFKPQFPKGAVQLLPGVFSRGSKG
jgi:hypothetical protein